MQVKDQKYTNPYPVRWDAHGCPPFKIGSDLSFLNRYKKSGVNFISLNVGFDLTSQKETLELLNYFYQWMEKHDKDFVIVDSAQKIFDAQSKNKLCIAFDIEGSNVLNNDLAMVEKFYELGVRQLVFAYNNNNSAGGGCLDADIGLTKFGKELVKTCNTIGMVIDCSHVGFRTSMEIMELSSYPIIFSHSNPAGLVSHPRNIANEQILACAETNGVIGINGIGIFLGNNDVRTLKIVEHIDYVVQLVGSEHVGIGLDCVFAPDEIQTFVESNPNTFPEKNGFNNVAVAQPEQFSEIGNLLTLRGYSEKDIDCILGENFFRVAKTVWK